MRLLLMGCFVYSYLNYVGHYENYRKLIKQDYQGFIYPKDIFYGNKKGFFEAENLDYLIFVKLKDSISYHQRYLVKGRFEEIESTSNPGAFDQQLFSFQNKVYFQLTVDSIIEIKHFSSVKNEIYAHIEKACRNHSDLFKSVLFACLLGDKSFMASEENALFAQSGLSHFFALSGLHVGLLLFILWSILTQITRYFYLRFTILVAILFFYISIVGLEAPIFRASLMSMLYLYGRYHNKITDPIQIFLVSLYLNLVIFPSDIFKLSFYLSYSAVFFIFYFMERFRIFEDIYAEKKGVWHRVKAYIVVVLAPYIGTIPISLMFFSKVPLASILNNLIILPFLVLLLYGMIFFLVTSLISMFWADILAQFIDSVLQIIVYLLRLSIEIVPIKNEGFTLEAFMLFIVGISLLHWKQIRRRTWIVFITVIASSLIYFKTYIQHNYLHFYSLQLGQAQSFLISYHGSHMLYDAGKDLKKRFQKKNEVLDFMNFIGLDTLNYLFVSHDDFDHNGNLNGLIFKESFLSQNDPLLKSHYTIDDLVVMHVKSHGFKSDKNDESIVLKLQFGQISILVCGDIGVKREKRLLESYGQFIQSDMLQVPHHGSKHSSSLEWCQVVSPSISLVTVGKNHYGHPDEEVMERYKLSEILRTDQIGYMHFISDGKSVYRLPQFIDKFLFQ